MSVDRCALLASGLALLVGISCLGQLPDLSGNWVMVQIYPQVAILPFAGEVNRASYVVQWVSVRQDGARLTMIDQYCFTHVDDGTDLVQTTIPRTFMAALHPLPRLATLSETEEGVWFLQDPYVEVRGADLADISADALPTDPLDPRVIDQDEDGAPGLSVSIEILGIITGETYIVQRVSYTLAGSVLSPDRIEGMIDWTDEQTVLEATNPLLKVDTIGYPDPDPDRSRFIMMRVPDDQSCEWLAESWWELFDLEKPGGIDDEAESSADSR